MSLSYNEDSDVSCARRSKPEKRMETAKCWKNEGNSHFLSGRIDDALLCYAKAWGTFRWFVRGASDASEEIVLIKGDENERELALHQEIVRKFLMVVAQNIAQCHLNRRQYSEAVSACKLALEFDTSNVKTLFRLALAHRGLDTSADKERGIYYLKLARGIEPENLDVRRLLRSMQDEMKMQNEIDRRVFGGFFERGSIEVKCKRPPSDVIASRTDGQSLHNLRKRVRPEHLEEFDSCVEAVRRKQLESDRVKLAEELGIDLSDPRVARELRRLEREYAEGTGTIRNSRNQPRRLLWSSSFLQIPSVVWVVMMMYVLVRGWLIWYR